MVVVVGVVVMVALVVGLDRYQGNGEGYLNMMVSG